MLVSDALTYFGTQTRLARALGVTKGAVWQWERKLKLVPPLRAAQLHALTKGELRFDPAAYLEWNVQHKRKPPKKPATRRSRSIRQRPGAALT